MDNINNNQIDLDLLPPPPPPINYDVPQTSNINVGSDKTVIIVITTIVSIVLILILCVFVYFSGFIYRLPFISDAETTYYVSENSYVDEGYSNDSNPSPITSTPSPTITANPTTTTLTPTKNPSITKTPSLTPIPNQNTVSGFYSDTNLGLTMTLPVKTKVTYFKPLEYNLAAKMEPTGIDSYLSIARVNFGYVNNCNKKSIDDTTKYKEINLKDGYKVYRPLQFNPKGQVLYIGKESCSDYFPLKPTLRTNEAQADYIIYAVMQGNDIETMDKIVESIQVIK